MSREVIAYIANYNTPEGKPKRGGTSYTWFNKRSKSLPAFPSPFSQAYKQSSGIFKQATLGDLKAKLAQVDDNDHPLAIKQKDILQWVDRIQQNPDFIALQYSISGKTLFHMAKFFSDIWPVSFECKHLIAAHDQLISRYLKEWAKKPPNTLSKMLADYAEYPTTAQQEESKKHESIRKGYYHFVLEQKTTASASNTQGYNFDGLLSQSNTPQVQTILERVKENFSVEGILGQPNTIFYMWLKNKYNFDGLATFKTTDAKVTVEGETVYVEFKNTADKIATGSYLTPFVEFEQPLELRCNMAFTIKGGQVCGDIKQLKITNSNLVGKSLGIYLLRQDMSDSAWQPEVEYFFKQYRKEIHPEKAAAIAIAIKNGLLDGVYSSSFEYSAGSGVNEQGVQGLLRQDFVDRVLENLVENYGIDEIEDDKLITDNLKGKEFALTHMLRSLLPEADQRSHWDPYIHMFLMERHEAIVADRDAHQKLVELYSEIEEGVLDKLWNCSYQCKYDTVFDADRRKALFVRNLLADYMKGNVNLSQMLYQHPASLGPVYPASKEMGDWYAPIIAYLNRFGHTLNALDALSLTEKLLKKETLDLLFEKSYEVVYLKDRSDNQKTKFIARHLDYLISHKSEIKAIQNDLKAYAEQDFDRMFRSFEYDPYGVPDKKDNRILPMIFEVDNETPVKTAYGDETQQQFDAMVQNQNHYKTKIILRTIQKYNTLDHLHAEDHGYFQRLLFNGDDNAFGLSFNEKTSKLAVHHGRVSLILTKTINIFEMNENEFIPPENAAPEEIGRLAKEHHFKPLTDMTTVIEFDLTPEGKVSGFIQDQRLEKPEALEPIIQQREYKEEESSRESCISERERSPISCP